MKFPKKVIGIIFGAMGLGYCYYAMQEQAATLKSQTMSIQNHISELKDTESKLTALSNNQAKYKEDTIALTEEAEQILNEFPTFMFLEDKILYADYLQNEELREYNVEETAYGDSKFVMSASYDESSLLELYSIGYSSKYNGLNYPKVKELIQHGLRDNLRNRFVLNAISISYSEETGRLNGEMSYSTYFIAGQNDPYEFSPELIKELTFRNPSDKKNPLDLFGARSMDEGEELIEGEVTDDMLAEIADGNNEMIIE